MADEEHEDNADQNGGKIDIIVGGAVLSLSGMRKPIIGDYRDYYKKKWFIWESLPRDQSICIVLPNSFVDGGIQEEKSKEWNYASK